MTGVDQAAADQVAVMEGIAKREAAARGAAKARPKTFATLLPGLADVVLGDDGPAFLMRLAHPGTCELLADFESNSGVLVPFPITEMPWALPRHANVLNALKHDSALELFIDLRAFILTAAYLPDERWADLLAAWVLLTYRMEDIHYLLILLLHGVPERGKTRAAKALIYSAWRGIIAPGIREAVLIRWRDYHRATIALDMENVAKQAVLARVDDLLLASFEKGGTIARVLWPEKGPGRDMRHYRAYGATVLVSNVGVRPHSALATRCLPLVLPEAGDRDFGYPPTPEDGLPFRERCVAWRVKTLGQPLPVVAKSVRRRLGDITLPLLQVLHLVAPHRTDDVREFVRELEREVRGTRSESWEGRVLEALVGLSGEVEGGQLLLKRVRERVNADAEPTELLTPHRVGRIVRDLGFRTRKGLAGERYVVYDGEAVEAAALAFGVGVTPLTPLTPPSGVGARGDSGDSGLPREIVVATNVKRNVHYPCPGCGGGMGKGEFVCSSCAAWRKKPDVEVPARQVDGTGTKERDAK